MALLLVGACAKSDSAPPPVVNHAQELVDAARGGDTAKVALLLSDGIAPDTLAPDGTRPLSEAARDGRVAVVKQLLAADANVDLKDSAGYRAFDMALEAGKMDVAAALTWQAAQVAGASPEANRWFAAVADHESELPPWSKALDGELESLGLLYATILDRTAVVSSMRHGAGIPNRTGITALAVAARIGSVGSVKALLEAGANADLATKDRWESTSLMEAAREGYIEVGLQLLEHGARIDHRDISGGTALHWAVRAGETAFAKMLLEHHADYRLTQFSGEAPIDIARRNNHEALIALLESYGGGDH